MKIISSSSMQSYRYRVIEPFMFRDIAGKYRAATIGEIIEFHESVERDDIIGLVRFGKILPVDYVGVNLDFLVIREINVGINGKLEKAVKDEVVKLKGETAAPLVAIGTLRPVLTHLWNPKRMKRPTLPDRSATYGDAQAPRENWVKGNGIGIDHNWKVFKKD